MIAIVSQTQLLEANKSYHSPSAYPTQACHFFLCSKMCYDSPGLDPNEVVGSRG